EGLAIGIRRPHSHRAAQPIYSRLGVQRCRRARATPGRSYKDSGRMAACDERVSGDARKHVDDALGVCAVELERLAEMACWSVGVVECWVSDASLHYSTTPVLQFC